MASLTALLTSLAAHQPNELSVCSESIPFVFYCTFIVIVYHSFHLEAANLALDLRLQFNDAASLTAFLSLPSMSDLAASPKDIASHALSAVNSVGVNPPL